MINNFNVYVTPMTPFNDETMNIELIKPTAKYVSDGIYNDFKSWNTTTPIFITAQMGRGKNTAIEKRIIPYAMEYDLTVLIISNRISANRQQKKRIAKIVNCENLLENYTPKGLDCLEDFANIKIISYQKLNSYFDNVSSNELNDFNFIVLDEAHFFLSDALFNNKTGKTLNDCIKNFKNSVRIYMTATPYEIFPIIAYKERNLSYKLNHFVDFYYKPFKIIYYDFGSNYDYLKIKYFKKRSELISQIQNSSSEEKWLIFVSNKTLGERIIKDIGSDSCFLCADSKNSKDIDGKIYNKIISDESFDCRCLVCTSAFDNGVNIKDPLVKNIAIFSYDRTQFLQMLGRKRFSEGETVNLYLYANKLENFNAKYFEAKKQVHYICQFKRTPSTILNQYISNPGLFMKGLIYFDINSKPHINELAEKKLYASLTFYKNVIDKFNSDGTSAFIKEQLSWMNLEKTFSPKLFLSYVDPDANRQEFIQFLDSYCNKSLLGNENCNFQKTFKEITNRIYGKQEGDRPDRKNYCTTKINKILKKYKFNYIYSGSKKVYKLCKQ